MKKFRKSPVAICCYVFAAIFAAYLVATEVSTISTIYEYYAPYDMTPTFGEVVSYMIQQGAQPLVAAVLTLMAGLTYEQVRRLNPANWATDDEIAEAKEAKAMAREARQIAKGEAARAAAEAAMDDSEGIKPEFAAAVAEESNDVVVFGGEGDEEAAAEADEPADEAEPDEAEPEEVFSDAFSAEIAEDEDEVGISAEEAGEEVIIPAEEVDEELAAELKKAVEQASKN